MHFQDNMLTKTYSNASHTLSIWKTVNSNKFCVQEYDLKRKITYAYKN